MWGEACALDGVWGGREGNLNVESNRYCPFGEKVEKTGQKRGREIAFPNFETGRTKIGIGVRGRDWGTRHFSPGGLEEGSYGNG